MVIVKIWGGIGNQLFQYIFGEYLRYCFKQDVKYDGNAFISTEKERKRELECIDPNIQYDNRFKFSKYRGVKGRLMRLLFQINPKHIFIKEDIYGNGSREGEIIKNLDPNKLYYFSGYWQDVKYYNLLRSKCPDFKIKSLDIPEELLDLREDIIQEERSLSIHIRRGDYFSPKNINIYGVCDESYFRRAFEIIKERVSVNKIYIFSDDLDWVRSNLSFDSSVVFVPNYDVAQFNYIELMSLCKHHIISNSSFSWWGAVLNSNDNSVVVSPSRWLLTSEKTIALDCWIKV